MEETKKTIIMFKLKGAPWDDINCWYLVLFEVVYPADHDLFFFIIFRFFKTFFINIYITIQRKPKQITGD